MNNIDIEVVYDNSLCIEKDIEKIEDNYKQYQSMENFNFKDFFSVIGVNRLQIDYRTKQLFDLYCFNLTNSLSNPFDYPYPIIETIIYLNSILKLGIVNG